MCELIILQLLLLFIINGIYFLVFLMLKMSHLNFITINYLQFVYVKSIYYILIFLFILL